MHSSCVVVLIFGVLTLGASGDGDTSDTSVADEAVNSSSSQSALVPVVLLLDLSGKEGSGNGSTPGRSQGNTSHPMEPWAVLLITTLELPVANDSGNASNSTVELGQPGMMAEKTNNRVRRSADSEARLIRRKRTFHKHKGCMICGMMEGIMHPQVIVMQEPVHYQPQSQQCNTCQQQPVYQPQPPPQPQPMYHPQQQPMYQPRPQPMYHPQPQPQPMYHPQPQPPPMYHPQPQPQPMNHPQPQPQQEYCDPCQQKQSQPHGGGGSYSHSQSSAQSSSSSGSWGNGKKK